MAAMERMWTVRDVMEVLPYGKTKVVSIVNSLPHINEGKKLLIAPHHIRDWMARNTKTGDHKPAPIKAKPRTRTVPGLTEDGLIPYRRTKKGA